MAPKPIQHPISPKEAQTGKGIVPLPPNKLAGSNHVPKTGPGK